MVYIKTKLLLFIAIAFLLINIAYAQSKLNITDVDLKVGSRTSDNLDDGETADDEAEPGDEIEVRIEVKNEFTSQSGNLEIKDIRVEATLEEIDDGDDFDEESSEFDLNPGRDKRVTLRFQVPIEVEEDTFDIVINVEGEDENGTEHRAEMTVRFEVDKENHLISLTRYSLTPNVVQCGKRSIQAQVGLLNLGTEDEEDVSLQITNSELGIDVKEEIGELTAEANEEESRFSNTYTFSIPQNTEAGSYPIIIRALYDNDRRKAEKTVTLTVNECPLNQNNQNINSQGTTGSTSNGVVVVTPPATNTGSSGTTQPEEEIEVPEGTVITSEGAATSNAFIVGIIIAEVVAVVIGIVLLLTLFRKK